MTPPAQSETAVKSISNSATQLTALLQQAGLSRLDQIGWIRVTGDDRVRWLNGMVTNSVQQSQTGHAAYNFFLNAQGRIQGDATIFVEPETLLIETASSQIPALITFLDRFIIMDDVELADTTQSQSGLLIAGPQAFTRLGEIGIHVENLDPLSMQTAPWNGIDVTVIQAYSPLVPRFELWTEPEHTDKLANALESAGALPCEPESLEWLRVLEGTPLYGTDIRDRDLPQETGQTRALHFNKGCYLGQEIVERIRSRGNVHRTFTAFQLEKDLPAPGAALEADGKQVGELTSVAAISLPTPGNDKIQLGLGYIRREVLDRNIPISYTAGIATPVSLPFFAAAPSVQRDASESSERA
jgi:folate-binding protein YgfZ